MKADRIVVGRNTAPMVKGCGVVEKGSKTLRFDPAKVRKAYHGGLQPRLLARRERKALARLESVEGVPALLDVSADGRELTMERLHGQQLDHCESPPETFFLDLCRLVEDMLERGVARHSLPERDLIVTPDATAGMVDFERVTLCRSRLGPVWLLAQAITRYHLRRLVSQQQAHLLSPAEHRRLRQQQRLRNALTAARRLLKGKPRRKHSA